MEGTQADRGAVASVERRRFLICEDVLRRREAWFDNAVPRDLAIPWRTVGHPVPLSGLYDRFFVLKTASVLAITRNHPRVHCSIQRSGARQEWALFVNHDYGDYSVSCELHDATLRVRVENDGTHFTGGLMGYDPTVFEIPRSVTEISVLQAWAAAPDEETERAIRLEFQCSTAFPCVKVTARTFDAHSGTW
jgi:hypothetical protein